MNKKIKMTIATGIFPPSIGGPAIYSKLLSDKFQSYGYEINIATFDSVRKFPKIISHILFFLLLLKKSFRSDFIYVQDPVSVGLPTAILSIISRKKYILKVVGDYAWEQGVSRFNVKDTLDEFVKRKQESRFVRFLQWIETFVANHARAIVVPSKYLKEIVMHWGVPDNRINVVYNAFNAPELDGLEKTQNNKFNIISIGRLVKWKGFLPLIDSIVSLKKEIQNIDLTIIGSGPEVGEIIKRIKENNAGEYIRLLPALPHKDMIKELSNSDCFVLYTGYEGFSHLILEAMAVGTPVITTKLGGNIEIIDNMKNGLLINRNPEELNKAITLVANDEILRKKIASEAKLSVLNYSEKSMFEGLDKAIRENI